MKAEASEEGVKSATDVSKDVVAEGLELRLGEARGEEGSGGDRGGEPTPVATVQVLTEENFKRITRVATGATTGDWSVGEMQVWKKPRLALVGRGVLVSCMAAVVRPCARAGGGITLSARAFCLCRR